MKEQSTTKGFAILSISQIISKVISIVYLPILINILNDEGYGIYSSAYVIYTFIYVIANSGIPTAISKIMSEFIAQGNYKDAIKSFKIARTILIIVGSILAMFMYFLAEPLAALAKSRQSALAIKALAPTILITSILSAYRGYFQGRANMTPTAISQVIEQFINIICSLIFASVLMKYGLEAGAAGGTIGTCLGAIFSTIYIIIVYQKNKIIKVPKQHKVARIRPYSNKHLIKKIVNYSIPMIICIGLINAGTLVDLWNIKSRLLVAGFNEANREVLFGWLTKSNSLINIPIAVVSCLAMAVFPAISGAAALDNRKELENKINYSFRICFLVTVPSAVGLAVLANPIYRLLKITGGAYLMTVGSIVVILMSLVQIQTTILQGIGKLYIVTLYTFIGILAKVASNYILVAIPHINILGGVISNIIGFLIPTILNLLAINKALGIKINLFKSFKKPFFASIIMGLTVGVSYFIMNNLVQYIIKGYWLNTICTMISVGIGILSYSYFLIIVGGITKKDISVMPIKLKRLIPQKILKLVK